MRTELPRVSSPRAPVDVLKHVLLAIAVVVAASRALGAVFRFFRQPPVIGEVVAGILLGPSLLGHVAPDLQAFLLPREVAPYLGVLAQVGVILFMFLVGLELDTRLLRKRSDAMVAISHASIVVPFVLGSTLALWLYPKLSSRDVSFTGFALFMGVSLSVTAFPVLARILTDRGLSRSRLGTMALACAAVDDATAWCLLAFVVSIVARGSDELVRHARRSPCSTSPPCSLVVRPLVGRFVRRQELVGALDRGATTAAFVALARVGSRHRSHRHSRALRRVPARRHRAPRFAARPRAHAPHRRHRERAALADLLRLHRHAHRNRPTRKRRRLDVVRRDHRRGLRREVRRKRGRRAAHGARLARSVARSAC